VRMIPINLCLIGIAAELWRHCQASKLTFVGGDYRRPIEFGFFRV
jgi:hypothetical protein